MRKITVYALLIAILMTMGGNIVFAEKSQVNYAKESQIHQFRPHGGDRAEINKTIEEILSKLNKPEELKAYIANGADKKEIMDYFKDLGQYKEVKLIPTTFEKFYQVKGYDEYTSFRGIVRFKYLTMSDDGKCLEHTDLICAAKLGKAPTDWKIWKILWQDSGIDVSDVKLFQLDPPAKGEEICQITTNIGVIKMRLFPEKAPLAVKNFKGLAEKGYYDDMIFSRVINDFVIQTGALDGSGKESESIYDGFFKDEFNNDLFNFRGALCMGNAGPNTNGNQFYIVQTPKLKEEHVELSSLPLNAEAKYEEIGGLPYLDKRYTVFGQVFEGLDVVDKIAAQKTDDEGMPLIQPIKMLKVEFIKY